MAALLPSRAATRKQIDTTIGHGHAFIEGTPSKSAFRQYANTVHVYNTHGDKLSQQYKQQHFAHCQYTS